MTWPAAACECPLQGSQSDRITDGSWPISDRRVQPTRRRSLRDPELPVVNGSFRQFGAHGWQEPDGVRMRARRTARSA